MKTFIKIIMAAIAAMFVAAWVESLGVGYYLGFVVVYFSSAISLFYGIEAVISIVKKRKQTRYDAIRPQKRNYGHAAVFVGTACLFIGAPQQCDALCDDLWHHGQQAHVELLSGNETFEIL